MATSKTTNTYNRQNWEDAVSIFRILIAFYQNTDIVVIIPIFHVLGIPNSLPNMSR